MNAEEIGRRIKGMPTIPRVYPETVYETVSSILRGRSIQRVLDYSAIPQSFIFRAADEFHPQIALACPAKVNNENLDLLEDSIDARSGEAQPNHCIYSPVRWTALPPRTRQMTFDVLFGVLDSSTPLQKPLTYLSQDGIAIFHVHTFEFSFLSRLGPLGSSGNFYVQGALAIPSHPLGSLFIEEYASEYLLVIENTPQSDLFIACLTDDYRTNSEVLENLRKHRKGRTLRYGLIAGIAYAAQDDYRYLTEATLTKDKIEFSHPTSEVVRDIEFGAENIASEGAANSMVLSIPDSDALATGYVRVLLDDHQILADYLGAYIDESLKHRFEWVRTEEDQRLGRLGRPMKYEHWLDRCSSEAQILHRILNTWILLPDLDRQRSIVRLAAELNSISAHTDMLRRKMWTHPDTTQVIEAEIPAAVLMDSRRLWISRLPYPLASILWVYDASVDIRLKYDILLFFFEALAEFAVTVMLSGLYADRPSYERDSPNWIDSGQEARKFFTKASIGNWVHIGTRLSSFLRKQLARTENQKTILYRFGGVSVDSLEAICDPELWVILREELEFRNRWKAHGGLPSEPELSMKLEELGKMLNRVRWRLSDRLVSMRFITRREEKSFRDDVHTYRAWVLEGNAVPLPECMLETRMPLESGEIYMIGEDQATQVKILPLIRLQVGEQNNGITVYFYNRLEPNGQVCYVAYQPNTKSDLCLASEEVPDLFEALEIDR